MSEISQWIDGTTSPYDVLGVARDADQGVIRTAHRKLALKLHPDRLKLDADDENGKGAARDEFQRVQQAYEILSDATRRSRYDDGATLTELQKERSEIRLRERVMKQMNIEARFGSPVYTFPHDVNSQKPPFKGLRSWLDGLSSSKYEGYEGRLNGHSICAISDTGADGNFVAHRIAAFTGMKVEPIPKEQRPSFAMAHGREISPVAKASAVWQFRVEPSQVFELEFFVLRDCIFDVMLGAEFTYGIGLLSTKIHLSTNLIRPTDALHIRHVKVCGFPRQRLTGGIRRTGGFILEYFKQCLVLPDSAAQPNIISYDYVVKRGWLPYIERSPPHCRLLQFVDGSLEETDGRIWLYWKFRRSRASQLTKAKHTRHVLCEPSRQSIQSTGECDTRVDKHRRPLQRRNAIYYRHCDGNSGTMVNEHVGPFAFDVLRGCPWDVIVGHVFLDSTDAFNSQAHCFTAIDDQPPLGLNPVVWAKAKEKSRDKQKHNGNKQSSPPTTSGTTFSTGNTLHVTLEALALKHTQERKLKRQPKLSNIAASALPNSTTTTPSAS